MGFYFVFVIDKEKGILKAYTHEEQESFIFRDYNDLSVYHDLCEKYKI